MTILVPFFATEIKITLFCGCVSKLPFSMSSILPITLPISFKPDMIYTINAKFDFVIDFRQEVDHLSCDFNERIERYPDEPNPTTPKQIKLVQEINSNITIHKTA